MGSVHLSFAVFISIKANELSITFLEATKASSSTIYRLVLETDDDDPSIRIDFRMLAEQAVPLELRQWVSMQFYINHSLSLPIYRLLEAKCHSLIHLNQKISLILQLLLINVIHFVSIKPSSALEQSIFLLY